MKKLVSLFIALALILSVSGAFAQGLTIGYSTKTITNDAFQLSLHDAVKAAVEANGDTFVAVLAESQTAVATQVSQIEDLINQGVDGLVLNPMDSNACIQVLEKAKAAGIPVVLVDQGVEAGHEDLYVTFISTDNLAGGTSAGVRMAEELKGEGNVIIVRGANGSQAGDDRADGFKAGIIVAVEDGIVEREGTFYRKGKGEELLGGWAEIYRKDRKMPFKQTVSLQEFDKGIANWKTMPGTMIRKVALVQALRECFATDLAGCYDSAEMDQSIEAEYEVGA